MKARLFLLYCRCCGCGHNAPFVLGECWACWFGFHPWRDECKARPRTFVSEPGMFPKAPA